MTRFTRMAVSFGILVLLLLVWTSAHAVTFTVTSNADSGAGTLREAIDMANANLNGPGVVDVIEFDLTLPDTISLTSGELTISDDLTINGPGADMLTVSGSNLSRIFNILGGTEIKILKLRIADGNQSGPGSNGIASAIFLQTINTNVELSDCIVEDNMARSLGAIAIAGPLIKLTVNRCSFTNNSSVATGTGSALGGVFGTGASSFNLEVNDSSFTLNYSQAESGVAFGGVISLGAANMEIEFNNCTFDSNYSVSTKDGSAYGGVLADGAADVSVDFTNCTFYNNSAGCTSVDDDDCQAYGGAIGSGGNSDISCNHCTFMSNSVSCTGDDCTEFGESIAPPGSDGSMTISNTIIQADDATNNCNGSGPVISLGYNIDNGSSCVDGTVMGDKANTDPMLDPLGLQDNGGLTETIALLPASMAIDMADPLSVVMEDQRKAPRPFSTQNDIGAFEFGALPPGGFFHNPITPALAANPNSLTAEEATPESPVAFVWGFTEGSVIVGGATCNGTELGIKKPRVLGIVDSSTEGIAELIIFIPLIGDFEISVLTQAVDISTCTTSEVIEDVIRKE